MDTSKQKPDLMGTSRSQPDGAKRILAHLEHGARLPVSKPARAAAWTLDGWTVGLALLLLAMCSIAWVAHDKTTTSGGYKAGYGSARASARHESKYETIRARVESARTPPTEVIIEPAELPAAIVNDDPALALARNRSDFIQRAATLDAVAGTSAASPAPKADMPAPEPATVAAAMARTAAVGAPRAKPAVASTKNTIVTDDGIGASATLTRAQATIATSARGKAPAPANDTDVALLAALVAHANKPTAVAPERSRDIVERHEGDNTAELLARCKQLGLIEGLLCRSRICSGRWESDATCRVPAH